MFEPVFVPVFVLVFVPDPPPDDWLLFSELPTPSRVTVVLLPLVVVLPVVSVVAEPVVLVVPYVCVPRLADTAVRYWLFQSLRCCSFSSCTLAASVLA